jgi:hypothetical protein
MNIKIEVLSGTVFTLLKKRMRDIRRHHVRAGHWNPAMDASNQS